VRRGPQPDGLRAWLDEPVVFVRRAMSEGDVQGHLWLRSERGFRVSCAPHKQQAQAVPLRGVLLHPVDLCDLPESLHGSRTGTQGEY